MDHLYLALSIFLSLIKLNAKQIKPIKKPGNPKQSEKLSSPIKQKINPITESTPASIEKAKLIISFFLRLFAEEKQHQQTPMTKANIPEKTLPRS